MPVTKEPASEFRSRETDVERLADTRAVFMKPDGTRSLVGETFRQPALARTLRMVASRGADYMYRGPWGEKLVAAVQADGGKMTMTDLAAIKSPVAEGWRLSGGRPQRSLSEIAGQLRAASHNRSNRAALAY